MSKEDEYRAHAVEAQAAADHAKNDSDRAAWLQIAAGWLSMIKQRPQTAKQKFDTQVKASETGQDHSDESH